MSVAMVGSAVRRSCGAKSSRVGTGAPENRDRLQTELSRRARPASRAASLYKRQRSGPKSTRGAPLVGLNPGQLRRGVPADRLTTGKGRFTIVTLGCEQ